MLWVHNRLRGRLSVGEVELKWGGIGEWCSCGLLERICVPMMAVILSFV